MSESHDFAAFGKHSPFPTLAADGATLGIGPDGLTMVVQLSRPRSSEIRAIRRDRLDVAIVSARYAAFLSWRFNYSASGLSPLYFETPFHIGLLPVERRYIPQRENGLAHAVMIFLQDERGGGHGGRLILLPVPICEAIEQAVAKQVAEAASPEWSRRLHDNAIAEFYRTCPDMTDVWRSADARGATQTRH